jgi:hypothetical protein
LKQISSFKVALEERIEVFGPVAGQPAAEGQDVAAAAVRALICEQSPQAISCIPYLENPYILLGSILVRHDRIIGVHPGDGRRTGWHDTRCCVGLRWERNRRRV